MDVKRYDFYHSDDAEMGMEARENPAGKWVLSTNHLAALTAERDRARGMAGLVDDLETEWRANMGEVHVNTFERLFDALEAYKSTQPAATPAECPNGCVDGWITGKSFQGQEEDQRCKWEGHSKERS